MKIGYARISIRDQNLDLQLDALIKAGCMGNMWLIKV
jgi:DNA invertase Pin-like site-specific DNA recombinase